MNYPALPSTRSRPLLSLDWFAVLTALILGGLIVANLLPPIRW